MSQAEQEKVSQEYGDFTRSIAGSGHLKGGNELDRISTATTVRVRDGKRVVTDGPFAETKEQLGGYYLVDAKDLDEAVALGTRTALCRSHKATFGGRVEAGPRTMFRVLPGSDVPGAGLRCVDELRLVLRKRVHEATSAFRSSPSWSGTIAPRRSECFVTSDKRGRYFVRTAQSPCGRFRARREDRWTGGLLRVERDLEIARRCPTVMAE